MRAIVGKELVIIPDSNIVDTFPDTSRYKHRFTINSETSNTKYMISFDNANGAGYWTCSCRGNIRNGRCKHLTSMNLNTRFDKVGKRLR